MNWRSSDGGAGRYYRLGKSKRVKASTVESAVLAEIIKDLRTPDFIIDLTAAARKQFDDRRSDDALPAMKKESADLDRRIKRITEMLSDTTQPEPLLRQVEQYELRKNELEAQIVRREDETKQATKVKALAAPQVSKVLTTIAEEFELMDRVGLHDFLKGLVEQIIMDETASTFQITYRIACATGLIMASPRGFEPLYSP